MNSHSGNVNSYSGKLAKVFTFKPESVFTLNQKLCSRSARITVHVGPEYAAVDFRKSHRGLSAIVQMECGHDPFTGVLYVFRNRAFNKLKIVFWENNGFVLYYKSLAEEKFHWPEANTQLCELNGEQLNWLLDGYDITRMKPHKVLRYESAC